MRNVPGVAPRAISDEPHLRKKRDPKRLLGTIPILLKEQIGDGPQCVRHVGRRLQPSLRLASDRTFEQVHSGVDSTAKGDGGREHDREAEPHAQSVPAAAGRPVVR